MEQYNRLLSPFSVGKLKLKNRMIATATVTDMAGEDGLPTEQFIRYHEEKARGGWGLVITEDYAVSDNGRTHKRLPGLWDDSQVPAHSELVRRVHGAGGAICVQLFHPGRNAGLWSAGDDLMAPSPVRDPVMPQAPREMTRCDIERVVDQFAQAARRAKACGFDAIEIHGAHGYLIHQFLSGFSNKRCDEYGGSIVNRARFALEVIAAVRGAVGSDFPISFRFNVRDHIQDGISVAEACAFARLLEGAGVNLLNCSQGVPSSRGVITPPSSAEPACYASDAAIVKRVVGIPVAVVGRITDPDIAEGIIAAGMADFVGMGRQAICDPYFPVKVMEGRPEDIIQCIACLRGCAGESRRGNSVHCALNPTVGYEVEDAKRFAAADPDPKRVTVIGGGVSGVQAAITAAHRGHEVNLMESCDALGGQWRMAAVPPGKSSLSSFVAWQGRQVANAGIKVALGARATAESILASNPDVVVVATGSTPLIPPIPGLAESSRVVDARDVLLGEAVPTGRVAVLGGGLVGAETADFLASGACEVTVIEMGAQVAPDAEPIPRACLLDSLRKHGVALLTSERIVRIEDGKVYTENNKHPLGGEDFDTLVTAFGANSEVSLVGDLRGKGYTGDIVVVGDAACVSDAFGNIREGYEAAMRL